MEHKKTGSDEGIIMSENTGTQGSPSSKPPVPAGPLSQMPPHRRRWWALAWGAVGWVWAVFAAVGVVVGNLAYFQPRLTVTPGTFLDPVAPFSVQFTVSNDGYIVLRDVRYRCAIKRIENAQGGGLFDFSVEPENNLVGTLAPGHPATVSCQVIPDAFKMPLPIVKGDIALWVQYRMRFFPWAFDEMYRFVTETLADGKLIWSSQPSWEEDK